MTKSFFIKYFAYKTGIRFTVAHEDGMFSSIVLHNEERHSDDECCKITDLQKRLRELFPIYNSGYCKNGECIGDMWFAVFLHDLATVSERMYRKYPQDRKRRHANK